MDMAHEQGAGGSQAPDIPAGFSPGMIAFLEGWEIQKAADPRADMVLALINYCLTAPAHLIPACLMASAPAASTDQKAPTPTPVLKAPMPTTSQRRLHHLSSAPQRARTVSAGGEVRPREFPTRDRHRAGLLRNPAARTRGRHHRVAARAVAGARRPGTRGHAPAPRACEGRRWQTQRGAHPP